jgi:tRNA uridine 5-carbamoylmethylation protein Kti12
MVFAKPKKLVKLRRRNKKAQRHINRLRAYHKWKVEEAFVEWYKMPKGNYYP